MHPHLSATPANTAHNELNTVNPYTIDFLYDEYAHNQELIRYGIKGLDIKKLEVFKRLRQREIEPVMNEIHRRYLDKCVKEGYGIWKILCCYI